LDQDTVDAPSLNCSKIDWIKLDTQGWISSWTGPLNPRPCHVGWPQDKATQGEHKVSTHQFFRTKYYDGDTPNGDVEWKGVWNKKPSCRREAAQWFTSCHWIFR